MTEASPLVRQQAFPGRTRADLSLLVKDLDVIYESFQDKGMSTLGALRGRLRRRPRRRQVHAVREVNLAIYRGEAVGLIGPNGSGKTTLMRAMAGVLPPSSGHVHARSAPVLLGVNAVLQPELSGRRNIVLGCTALGLSRREALNLVDDIIEFSGLGEFIDLPMRNYSSGMGARLRFSIASAVTPEIILVDEALSVGDAEFSERSEERMRNMLEQAGTIVLTSHNAKTIQATCSRALWMHQGRLIQDGPVEEVLDAYKAHVREQRKDRR